MLRPWTKLWLIAAAVLAATASSSHAQSRGPTGSGANWNSASDEGLAKLNDNTITIIGGNPSGTYLKFAYDMSLVLDGDQIRILPMVGRGGGQNVLDLLKLKGVDLAITQTDILKHFRKNAPNGGAMADRLTYITKLNNEEMHVLARSGIADVQALARKTVNFGESGSGEDISGRLIFEMLGIPVTAINVDQSTALVMMKSGQLDATISIAGKPSTVLNAVSAADGFKLLAVPFTQAMEDDYLPVQLTSADYPNMIQPGTSVDSVAVGAVLVAYNWGRATDRYARLARFIPAFFGQLAEFQKPPRHAKWGEVNLAAILPGWRRFPAAQEWLDAATKKRGLSQAQR